jgi:succinate dehydrogenase / fumarate reductase cytochrome b subunit
MVPVLALGFIVHIVYAFILTAGNLKARGGVKRYEVSNKTKTDSWASRNMIYLGVVVLAGLALHLTHFWSKMQLPELTGGHPENPNELIAQTFGSLCMTILYVVWFASIWLHLTHGFWSAFQTLGWNNNKWQVRLKWVGIVIVTVLMAGFAITAVCGYLEANNIINLH